MSNELIDDNSLLNTTDFTEDDSRGNQLEDELLQEDEMLEGDNVIEDDTEAINDDSDDDDEELQIIKEYEAIYKELEVNQYAYDKYVRLCELSQ